MKTGASTDQSSWELKYAAQYRKYGQLESYMIKIDGSFGEGGGQILRTSLGLSLVTGKAFTIENIRSGREKAGLLRQHLTAVNAAVSVCNAEVIGNSIGSGKITFTPGNVMPGAYTFSISTAGSATLVLQTVLPALLTAESESTIVLEGGTHNPFAPPFDFLKNSFLKVLEKMGVAVEASIETYGFYPAGGGRMIIKITPVRKLKPIDITERGIIKRITATALFSAIPADVAKGELALVQNEFGLQIKECNIREVKSPGPGNALLIEIESEAVTEVVTAFGERRVSRDKVAKDAIENAKRYIDSGVPVGEHLADQLIIPMALAGGGTFHTMELTQHTLTNIEIVKRFVDIDIAVVKVSETCREIRIGGLL